MNEKNAKLFLEFLGVHNGSVNNAGWYVASCPMAFHRHKKGTDKTPSFGIFMNPTGRSGYSCLSCNLKSQDLADLILEIQFALQAPFRPPPEMDLAKALVLAEKENELGYFETEFTGKIVPANQQFEEFPSWWLESFKSIRFFPEAMAYMESRMVSKAVMKALDMRYDSLKKAVCWPVHDSLGRFAGLRGRYLNPKGEAKNHDYKWNGANNTKLVLLNENRINWFKPIIVVEGETDLSRVYSVYRNVVGNGSTSLTSEKVGKLETAGHVFGLFDDDEAGAIASELLHQKLKSSYTPIKYPEPRLLKQFEPGKGKPVKDPGDCLNDQLVQLIAKHLPVDEFI